MPFGGWFLFALAVLFALDIARDIREGSVSSFTRIPVERRSAPVGFWGIMAVKSLFVIFCAYWIYIALTADR
jgi:hypothetical protein